MTFSSALLICVLFRRKRDAWNSPIKRMSLVFSFFLVFSSLSLACVEFYNGFVPSGYCKVLYFSYFYNKLAMFLYMVVIVVVLLIKIGSPVIDQFWKQWSDIVAVEVTIHIIVSLFCLSFSFEEEFLADICVYRNCGPRFDGTLIVYIIMSLVVCVIACTVTLFYVRFCRIAGVATRVKSAIAKCFTVLTLLAINIALEISFYWFDQAEEYQCSRRRNHNQLLTPKTMFLSVNNVTVAPAKQ